MSHNGSRRPFPLLSFYEAKEAFAWFWVFCPRCGNRAKRRIKPVLDTRFTVISEYEKATRCRCGAAGSAMVIFPDGKRRGDYCLWR